MLATDAILQNRYRILRQLGQGGMGTVYLAEDQRFGSQVALKAAHFAREDVHRAFAREAELLHRLRHPALPVVMDYFTEEQGQYLIMQFIPGRDLEELLVEKWEKDRSPFPVGQVLQWADQLLAALEYLHGHQPPIIHRDIKPQNLKLTPRGEVILLDFGLAKGAATGMSQAGASLRGYTRHYAPLEQIDGTGTDPRSDLYSLAATLYRLLTGTLPVPATTRAATIFSGQPDPLRLASELNPQIPASVAEAMACALAQSLHERPRTAKDMRRALCNASWSNTTESSFDFAVIGAVQPANMLNYGILNAEHGLRISGSQSAITATSESTYAGQSRLAARSTVADDMSPHDVDAHSGRARAKSPWAIGLMVVVLLIMGIVQYVNRKSAQSAISVPEASRSPVRVEVMKYCLLLEAADGQSRCLAADTPLVAGQRFKLRFTSRQRGYLYIIAPNVREVPTVFLSAQPNLDWGVKTNQVDADVSYDFPPAPDKWLRITGQAEAEVYNVVFAPTPVSTPRFLTEAAGRELTESEQREWAAFQQQQAKVSTEPRGDQSGETPHAVSAPVVFEIKVRRQTRGK